MFRIDIGFVEEVVNSFIVAENLVEHIVLVTVVAENPSAGFRCSWLRKAL